MAKLPAIKALGLLDGIPVIGRLDFFDQYGIVHQPGEVVGGELHLDIRVIMTTSRRHTFYAMNREDVDLLAEKLSRIKRTEVKIMWNTNTLKMWHCGQVVMGKREPRDFEPGLSEEENNRYTF